VFAVFLKESMDSESQCQSPTLVSRESNTTRVRRKAKEIQTPFSYVECTKCQHPEQLEKDSEKVDSFCFVFQSCCCCGSI
jgi:hypothetical protein